MHEEETKVNKEVSAVVPRKQEYTINWITVLWYIHLHFVGACGLWFAITDAKWMTVLYAIFITSIACIGLTVGAHRYYAHQTFATVTSMRIFFVLAHTLAGVGSIYDWVLLHRIHHKYFGTNKDPFNTNKGFIQSHFIGNIKNYYQKDSIVVKSIDMRDVESDGFVWIQHRFYWILFILVTLLFPLNVPLAYWNESFLNSFLIVCILRLAITCHVSWLVNSAITVWGLKPTDKYPVDDNSVFYIKKSYWPNYHYLFPRDWKSSEFGKYDSGCGTVLIKLWYELGFVNTLTTMSSENVREALYKIASKKETVQEAIEELEKLSEQDAVRQKLCYSH